MVGGGSLRRCPLRLGNVKWKGNRSWRGKRGKEGGVSNPMYPRLKRGTGGSAKLLVVVMPMMTIMVVKTKKKPCMKRSWIAIAKKVIQSGLLG